jgi:hypothetical protein
MTPLAGFERNGDSRRESTKYDDNLGKVVRIVCQGYTWVGRLSTIDSKKAKLQPYLMNTTTPLSQETSINEDEPAIVETLAIQGMEPLPENYLEKYVKDSELAKEKDAGENQNA